MAVKVSQKVFDGLEAVRSSGVTNMFDRTMVVKLLKTYGFSEAEKWVRENPEKYSELIFKGVEVIADEK